MDAENRKTLLDTLDQSQQTVSDAIAGVTEEKAAIKPAPERWSVLECMEHVALVEHLLFQRLVQGGKAAASMQDTEREEAIRKRLPDRSFKGEAPEHARPAGRYASLAEAHGVFLTNRKRTRDFIETTDEDLYFRVSEHRLFGKISGHDQALIIAYHSARHAGQIREIREAIQA